MGRPKGRKNGRIMRRKIGIRRRKNNQEGKKKKQEE